MRATVQHERTLSNTSYFRAVTESPVTNVFERMLKLEFSGTKIFEPKRGTPENAIGRMLIVDGFICKL